MDFSIFGRFTDLYCLTQVQKIVPKDPDATKKLRECEKEIAKIRFENAIAMEDHDGHSVAENLDFHSIGTPDTN